MSIPAFRVILPTTPVKEGEDLWISLVRTDESRLYENIPVTISVVANGFNGEATGADISGPTTIQTVIPARGSVSVPMKIAQDLLQEGPESLTLYVTETGSEIFGEFYSVQVADTPRQDIKITYLDPSLTLTEGQSGVLRMKVEGNMFGVKGVIASQLGQTALIGGQHVASTKFDLAPGQTYAEVRLDTIDDTLRENDLMTTFGNNYTTRPGYSNTDGVDTYLTVTNTQQVTLLDNDWGSATPSININGSNNTVNVYNDNRSYVNSFNVSNTLNQTYVNSFNGTSGKDTLTGTAQNDQLAGGNGNDVLKGAQGADSVIGGGGTDQLFGGLGANVLNGGAGRDTYNVAAERDAAAADILQGLTAKDRIVILGGNNLTFQQMNDGVGIFNNGTLQALAQGTLGLDTVRSLTTAI